MSLSLFALIKNTAYLWKMLENQAFGSDIRTGK